MFYGAADETTAIAEVWPPGKRNKHLTVGSFVAAQPMTLLDLTLMKPIPSFYDTAHQDERTELRFLAQFATDLSQPVDQNGREHIDYVPTQIVTEYFRRVFVQKVDGIVYSSCQNEGGRSCVLFVENDGCRDVVPGWEVENRAALGLLPGSLRTYSRPGDKLQIASVRRARKTMRLLRRARRF
jgi:hypothetical protein